MQIDRNPLLRSLLSIAESSLAVRNFAEHNLWYLEPVWSNREAAQRMRERNLDFAPVRESLPCRYLDRALVEKRPDCKCVDCGLPIDATHLVTSSLGLAEGVRLLKAQAFYFVLEGNRLNSIVTRADLRRPADYASCGSLEIQTASAGIGVLVRR